MSRVTYELDGRVATITMDDGKVNALSLDMQGEINAAIDRAESDEALVVLAGREGRFSAGFDLRTLMTGAKDAPDMLRGGFELSARLLAYPYPVVIACTGHAIAMGAFLLLSGDYRVGPAGAFKIRANEVAIGLTMPFTAIEICRQRLTPANFDRAVLLAEEYTPQDAVGAGFLDVVVDPAEVVATARAKAAAFAELDLNAHRNTKLRTREQALAAILAAIEADDAGVRAMLGS
jgi:enoyl-CoA hydratase